MTNVLRKNIYFLLLDINVIVINLEYTIKLYLLEFLICQLKQHGQPYFPLNSTHHIWSNSAEYNIM